MAEGLLRQIKARIGGARILLEALQQDPVRHQASSRSQTCALMELVKTNEFLALSAADKAELVARASEVPWHEDDLQPVLAKLQPAPAKEKKPQRGAQTFLAFPDFFDEGEWQTLQDTDVSMPVKKVVIVKKAAALGLVTPCERTVKLLNSFWICVSVPDLQELRRLPQATKRLWLGELKKDFDLVQRTRRDCAHIRTFPADSLTLEREYPHIYKRACPMPPVKCKLPLTTLSEVEASYRCRGNITESVSVAQPQSQQLQTPAFDGMQMMAQFMQCMLSQRQPENPLQGLLKGAPSARLTRAPLCLSDGVTRAELRDTIALTGDSDQAKATGTQAPPCGTEAAPSGMEAAPVAAPSGSVAAPPGSVAAPSGTEDKAEGASSRISFVHIYLRFEFFFIEILSISELLKILNFGFLIFVLF